MWSTSALTCCAMSGGPLCSKPSRADRCPSAAGPATTVAPCASLPYRSSSARWQTTARSAAPASASALIRPSTYRPSAPRSVGTSVASTSTRSATTPCAPFEVLSARKPTPCPAADEHHPYNRSAGWDGPARLDGLQVRDGLRQGAHLHHAQPGGNRPPRGRPVPPR